MMTFFPVPYVDELLYSILARYHIRSGNISYKATIKDAFGSKTATAVVDLPCNIQNLINNMPSGSVFTADEIIEKYTLFSFYTAFLPPERANQIKSSMLGSRGGDIYSRAGIMASSITMNRFLKYCPECAKEDYANLGELYWHRVHQIPCVICPKHGIPLKDSQVLVSGFNKHEFTAANISNCRDEEGNNVLPIYILDRLLEISNDVKYLLDNVLPNRSIEWFKIQYIELVKEKGYATVNGKLYRKKLLEDFYEFYGEELLKYLQSSVNPCSETNWLTDMLYSKERTAHPIRHLLLIRFFGVSIPDVFYKKFEYNPFGSGPWICLNSAAEHYLQPVVEKIRISYSSENKEPIGTFYCNCGFVYTRSGYDKDDTTQYTYTKIKQFGHVWEKRLKEVVSMGLSLRETARLMGADPGTVKKYAKKLGLQTFWKERGENKDIENNKKIVTGNENIKRDIYRREWLKLRERYPEKSKKELRLINQKVYMWLYRNDRQWLDDNSPQGRYVYVNKRVDWNKRDKELLPKIKRIVEELLSYEGKPKRISVGIIGNKLGIKALLEKHLDKLPTVKEYLETVIENDDDYRQRRINWAILQLQKEDQDIKVWKVLRMAGIREEYYEQAKEQIDNCLSQL